MAGKGGGAWKVAYADFVTAMMAFFLVMWITAQSNSIKQAIQKYFEHPYDAASRSPVPSKGTSGASLVPLHRDMDGPTAHASSKGKTALGGGMLTDSSPPTDAQVPKSGGLRRRSGLMLRDGDPSGLGNVITFAGNSADLDDRAKQTLLELVPVFLGKMNKIEIRGHTAENSAADGKTSDKLSAEKTGNSSSPDMWRLSYDRCLSAMQFLEQHGVEARRIRLSQAGPYEPPKTDDDDSALSSAARVDVYLLPEYVDDYLGHSAAKTATASAEPAAGRSAAPESAQSESQPQSESDSKKTEPTNHSPAG